MKHHDDLCNQCNDNLPGILNEVFSEKEIHDCIQVQANKKAAGIDGLINEMFKYSNETITPILTGLFNKILQEGCFPQLWREAIIFPILKGGSQHEPSNYRGISLLCSLSKIFTKLINNRLVMWADENNVRHEEQAGYRKNYSTVDQIFTLQCLVQKYLCKKKGRCYVIFVDFSKAFDAIPHLLLWFKLINTGIHGRVLEVLRSMYLALKSCARTPEGITNFFECKTGTRQGCMLSPFLFILYIGELIDMLDELGCHGIYVNEYAKNIMILLYADDMALIADTVGRLQRMIDVLESYCCKWNMLVNLIKTKIMVFRRGGVLRKNEQWFYNEKSCFSI